MYKLEDIQIGDFFQLQLSPNGNSCRYDYDFFGNVLDSGYSGEKIDAVVLDIDDFRHILTLDCKEFTFGVPFPGHENYTDDQWKWPGYPCKLTAPKNFGLVSCTCGSWKTYGKAFGAHSDWCDLKK